MEQITINELPRSILLSIFRYLSMYELLLRAGLVCKSWYCSVRDQELWMAVDLSDQKNLTPQGLEKVLSYSDFKLQRLVLPHLFHTDEKSAFAIVLNEEYLSSLLSKCQCLKSLRLCMICWRSVINVGDLQESNRLLRMEGLHGLKDKRDICMLAASNWQLAKETGIHFWLFLEFTSVSTATKNRRLRHFLQSLCEKESEEKILRESCGIPILCKMKQEERLITKMKRMYIFEKSKSRIKKHAPKDNLHPRSRVAKEKRRYQQPRKGVLQRSRPACIKQ